MNVQQLAAACKGRMTTNEGKQNSSNLKKKKKEKRQATTKHTNKWNTFGKTDGKLKSLE